jgi:DNA-binding LacI/PurR family transcriptional regulator
LIPVDHQVIFTGGSQILEKRKNIMSVSQKQIAHLCNVSIVTIYNALHRPELVKPETRKNIYEIMKQYDYLPNALARSMVRRKSNTVGILVPFFEARYFAKLISIMENVFSDSGYRVLISQHCDNTAKETREIELFREYQTDGLILCNCTFNSDPTQFARLKKAGYNFVLVDGFMPGYESHFIGEDDRLGSRKLVEKLIASGRRKIVYLGFHRTGDFRNSNRYLGYCDALKNCGIELNPTLTAACNDEYNGGAEEILALLAKHSVDKIDAVCCVNDSVALNVVLALKHIGIIPQTKILVAGYSGYGLQNEDLFGFSLVTVKTPLEELGKRAAEKLIRMIEHPEIEQKQELCFGKLYFKY